MAILRIKAVKAELGLKSNTSVYTAMREGLLTRSVSLSKRSVGWPAYEVHAICAARVAGKTDDGIRELVQNLHRIRSNQLMQISEEIENATN